MATLDKTQAKQPNRAAFVNGMKAVRDVHFEHADGRLIHEIGSEAETKAFEEFTQFAGEHPVFKRASPFWRLACLRARKFDMGRALQLLTNYYEWCDEYGIHTRTYHKDELFKQLVERGVAVTFGNKDKTGRYILTLRPSRNNPAIFSPRYTITNIHAAIECLLRHYPEAQARGVVFVCDLSGYTIKHMDSRIPREVFTAFSKRIPVRFGGVYVLNPPFFMRMVFPIVRAFMSEKMKERMKLISNGYGQLREFVAEDQLPTFMNGSYPTDVDARIELIKQMQEENEYAEVDSALSSHTQSAVSLSTESLADSGRLSTYSEASDASSQGSARPAVQKKRVAMLAAALDDGDEDLDDIGHVAIV
eukprot:m.7041 g.7041  ORF g.7041 m.7041 type:complete len:362 (+) comp5214_c0_seq1:576-1661(+)